MRRLCKVVGFWLLCGVCVALVGSEHRTAHADDSMEAVYRLHQQCSKDRRSNPLRSARCLDRLVERTVIHPSLHHIALFDAAVAWDAVDRPLKALVYLEKALKQPRALKLHGVRILQLQAYMLQKSGQYTQSAQAFHALARRYPKAPEAQDALVNATMLFAAECDTGSARAAVHDMLKLYKAREEPVRLATDVFRMLRICRVPHEGEAFARTVQRAVAKRSLVERFRFESALARCLADVPKPKRTTQKTLQNAQRKVLALGQELLNAQRTSSAHEEVFIRSAMAEVAFRLFDNEIRPQLQTTTIRPLRTEKEMAKPIQTKVRATQLAQAKTHAILQLKSSPWSIAALRRHADLNAALYRSLKTIQPPNPSSQEKRKAFAQNLNTSLSPILEKTRKQYELCTQRAQDLGVWNEHAQACLQHSQTLRSTPQKALQWVMEPLPRPVLNVVFPPFLTTLDDTPTSKARDSFTQGIQHLPHTLASSKEHQNAVQKALPHWKAALQADPTHTPSRYNMALSYAILQDTPKALSTLQPLLSTKTPPAAHIQALSHVLRPNSQVLPLPAPLPDTVRSQTAHSLLVSSYNRTGCSPTTLSLLSTAISTGSQSSTPLLLRLLCQPSNTFEAALLAIDPTPTPNYLILLATHTLTDPTPNPRTPLTQSKLPTQHPTQTLLHAALSIRRGLYKDALSTLSQPFSNPLHETHRLQLRSNALLNLQKPHKALSTLQTLSPPLSPFVHHNLAVLWAEVANHPKRPNDTKVALQNALQHLEHASKHPDLRNHPTLQKHLSTLRTTLRNDPRL